MELGLLGCEIALRDDDAEDEQVVVAEIPI